MIEANVESLIFPRNTHISLHFKEFQSRDYQGKYPDKLLFQFYIRFVLLTHYPHFGAGMDVFSTSDKIVVKIYPGLLRGLS